MSNKGRPAITEYEAQSGVMFNIAPINLPTLRAIQLKALELFPDIDPFPYTEPEENAFDPSQRTDPKQNPEYLKAVQKVGKQRKEWVDKTIFTYCVTMPAYPSQKELIEAYGDKLRALKAIAIIEFESDYEAILFHILLSWNLPALDGNNQMVPKENEYGRIISLCIQTVALTPAEVTSAARLFRPAISRT